MKTKIFFTLFVLSLTLMAMAQEEKSLCHDKLEVSIRDVDEIHMVYYKFTGPYMNSFNDFGKLMEYLKTNEIPMGPHALGIFYDDPAQVPEDQLRSEAGFMIQGKAEIADGFYYRNIPATKAVTVKYKSIEDIMPAYEAIAKYLQEKEIKTVPYSIEIYYSTDPNVVDAEILFLIDEKSKK
jgi:effector-binding domain-containing protein